MLFKWTIIIINNKTSNLNEKKNHKWKINVIAYSIPFLVVILSVWRFFFFSSLYLCILIECFACFIVNEFDFLFLLFLLLLFQWKHRQTNRMWLCAPNYFYGKSYSKKQFFFIQFPLSYKIFLFLLQTVPKLALLPDLRNMHICISIHLAIDISICHENKNVITQKKAEPIVYLFNWIWPNFLVLQFFLEFWFRLSRHNIETSLYKHAINSRTSETASMDTFSILSM